MLVKLKLLYFKFKMKFFQNLIACKATFYILEYFNCIDTIMLPIENIHQFGWIDAHARRKDWNDFIKMFNKECNELFEEIAEKK